MYYVNDMVDVLEEFRVGVFFLQERVMCLLGADGLSFPGRECS